MLHSTKQEDAQIPSKPLSALKANGLIYEKQTFLRE